MEVILLDGCIATLYITQAWKLLIPTSYEMLILWSHLYVRCESRNHLPGDAWLSAAFRPEVLRQVTTTRTTWADPSVHMNAVSRLVGSHGADRDNLTLQCNVAGSRVALEYATWILVRQRWFCRTSRVALEFVSHYSTFTVQSYNTFRIWAILCMAYSICSMLYLQDSSSWH